MDTQQKPVNSNEKTFSKIFLKIKENKLLSIVVLFSIIVVLIVTFMGYNKKTTELDQENTINSYILNLEEKVKKALSSIEGAGKVDVVINIESGMETVLAMKTTTTEYGNKTEIETSPIVINGKTVVIKEQFPQIKGVLIVVEGGNNISVISKISRATMSLLDIEANKIEILKMK